MSKLIKKTQMIVEHACLELVHSAMRLQQKDRLYHLTLSIEQYGQQVPVIVVEQAPQRWALIDGYLRMKALQHLNQDTIAAEIWDCELPQALLTLLAGYQSRPFEAFEEALLLQALQCDHGLSQGTIASSIGRDRTWVCRRLGLIDHLPKYMIEAILKGSVSLWAAQRVLAPVARATPSHAEKLLDYLIKNSVSTRALQTFYQHYQRSHRQTRSKMIDDLGLFFKAQQLLQVEKKAKYLRGGPEEQWSTSLTLVISELKKLVELLPQVFCDHQPFTQSLLDVFYKAKSTFDLLIEKLEEWMNVNERNPTNNIGITPDGEKFSGDQSTS